MFPLPTQSKCLDAEGKHLGLRRVETIPLNGAQGRAGKAHFNPGSELCQGLGSSPLRRNCERSHGVGREDGACRPCLTLLLLRARLHWFDLLGSFRQREDIPVWGTTINLSSVLLFFGCHVQTAAWKVFKGVFKMIPSRVSVTAF